jgi:hypothetical protein
MRRRDAFLGRREKIASAREKSQLPISEPTNLLHEHLKNILHNVLYTLQQMATKTNRIRPMRRRNAFRGRLENMSERRAK